ncbi:hypothetical protein FZC66_17440 [Priestia megaterium]|nr:hypothetical protein FZC66_17440 [Priestia megaterium]
MRRLLMLVLAVWFVVPFSVQAGVIGGDPSVVPGQWHVGDTPSYVDPAKPPIVFIHGFNSSSKTWWEENDMYQTAYENGYQTAFVDVHPDKNMWTNGPLLATKLREIYDHFGEKKLVVVAHSKGGIDTQNALVHQGAYPYVSNLITLSTPHHGSQLADLAYSNWTSWLSGILGSQNDAIYSLQTGYMKHYRTETDSHANVYRNPIYTFGGTSWGSFGSPLYFGGMYLNSHGQNDGAVTITSSRLPYATEVRIGEWDHLNIIKGSSTFALFKPYLTNVPAASFSAAGVSTSLDAEENIDDSSAIYRGGEFTNEATQTFTIEEGTKQINVDWLSDQKMDQVQLVSPSGKTYTKSVHSIDEGVFKGAHHHMFQLNAPEAGTWKVEAKHAKAAYFLNVNITSPLNSDVQLNTITPSSMEVVHTNNIQQIDANVKIKKNGKVIHKQQKKMNKKQKIAASLTEEGVHNITVDVKGKTKNGKPFERTIVKSVYVDGNGKVYK